MIPPSTMSDEDFKELADDLRKYTKSLFFGPDRRRSIFLAVKVLSIAAGVGLTVGLLVALGQGIAIGYVSAWDLYYLWWLYSPLIAIGGVVGLFVGSLLIFGGGDYLFTKVGSIFSDSGKALFEKITMFIMISGIFGTLIVLPLYLGYQHASDENKLLSGRKNDLENLALIEKKVITQKDSLSLLSKNAKQLVRELDSTEEIIKSTKDGLVKTLTDIADQIQSVDSAINETGKLISRQRQIQLRSRELERILDGRAPITKEDMKRSSNFSLLIGTLFGFFASLAASYVFNKIVKSKKNRS